WNFGPNGPGFDSRLLRGQQDTFGFDFTSSGSWVITASYDGTLRTWNLDVPIIAANPKTLRGHAAAPSCLLSDDGRWLAVQNVLWDLQSPNAPAHPRNFRRDETILAFSPNSRWMVTKSTNSGLQVWDVQQSEPQRELELSEYNGKRVCTQF